MNNLTQLWNNIAEELVNMEKSEDFIEEVYDRFGEIFDIKDVTEYKSSALVTPFLTPAQFNYLSLAIRRAFIEGYLLSKTEQRKEQVKLLFNCYKDEPEERPNEQKKKTINDFIASAAADRDNANVSDRQRFGPSTETDIHE